VGVFGFFSFGMGFALGADFVFGAGSAFEAGVAFATGLDFEIVFASSFLGTAVLRSLIGFSSFCLCDSGLR